MKSNKPSTFYFSAYPLKAITGSSAVNQSTQSPYLRSVLAGGSKISPSKNRNRIFPMINPYKASTAVPKVNRLTKNVEGAGDEWFNHYE